MSKKNKRLLPTRSAIGAAKSLIPDTRVNFAKLADSSQSQNLKKTKTNRIVLIKQYIILIILSITTIKNLIII